MTGINSDLSIRSSQLIRIYICNIILIIEVIFYFLSGVYSVYILQMIYCFSFGLWWFGLLSDLYSTTLIMINWVNNLVFGEQYKVYHYRGLLNLILNAGITLGLVI